MQSTLLKSALRKLYTSHVLGFNDYYNSLHLYSASQIIHQLYIVSPRHILSRTMHYKLYILMDHSDQSTRVARRHDLFLDNRESTTTQVYGIEGRRPFVSVCLAIISESVRKITKHLVWCHFLIL